MKFTKSIQTSDLQLFGSLEEAKLHELTLCLGGADCAQAVLKNSAKVLDILTTKENSRPAGRAINGATRKKRLPKIIEHSETAA